MRVLVVAILRELLASCDLQRFLAVEKIRERLLLDVPILADAAADHLAGAAEPSNVVAREVGRRCSLMSRYESLTIEINFVAHDVKFLEVFFVGKIGFVLSSMVEVGCAIYLLFYSYSGLSDIYRTPKYVDNSRRIFYWTFRVQFEKK